MVVVHCTANNALCKRPADFFQILSWVVCRLFLHGSWALIFVVSPLLRVEILNVI